MDFSVTDHALQCMMTVLDEWTQILQGEGCISRFPKAFDSVAQGRLLKKLYGYSIRGKVLRWVGMFLMDRIQRVVVNTAESAWSPVKVAFHRVVYLDLFYLLYL